jgi:transposase InsO family protein
MGAVGSCFDNAVVGTFFPTLTKELPLHDTPKEDGRPVSSCARRSSSSLRASTSRPRLHSTLGMRSPAEYEAGHAAGDPDGLARTGMCAIGRENL